MLPDLTLTVLLATTALLTSALSGAAGLGGGTIFVATIYAAGLAPMSAIPLFAMVQLVSNSTRTIAYLKDVEWQATGWFLLTLIPATLLLTPFAARVNVHWVQLLLAALILYSLLPKVAAQKPLPAKAAYLLAGLLNGALGLVVGATGLVVGRLFFRPEWTKSRIVATLAVTQVLGHGLRVLAYGAQGFSAFAKPQLLVPCCVAVVMGTVLGKKLNNKISDATFRTIFKTLLIGLSLKLIVDGVLGLLH